MLVLRGMCNGHHAKFLEILFLILLYRICRFYHKIGWFSGPEICDKARSIRPSWMLRGKLS